jgi:hypothetical protein
MITPGRKTMRVLISATVLAIFLSGCATMAPHEKIIYSEIQDAGAMCEVVAVPSTAGALNILPGGGDIYLAGGRGANPANWGAFALDFLFWPVSIVWAIPQAVVTAEEVNKIECVRYYSLTERGKTELQKLKQR